MSTRAILATLLGLMLIASACTTSDADPTSENDPSSDTSQRVENESLEPPRGLSDDELGEMEALLALYIEERGSSQAIDAIELMTLSEDPAYAPFLIDLLRLGNSTILLGPLTEGLQLFSGLEPQGTSNENFIQYGSWLQGAGIDPAPGYRDFKLALYERPDDEFVALLDSVESDAVLALIHWGGVPRGGIPELNDQERVSAAEADWMTPDELVLGVEIDGEAVAYPLRILARHELANDTLGGIPISVVFCTLCRTGLTFDRRVQGEVLDFQTSGLLTKSNKIMVDVQTDTLWRHLEGVGFGGQFDGVELVQYPTITTTWADWLREHPGTETLTFPEPIFFDDPERPPIAYDYTPGTAYQSYYENPGVWFPILDTPDTFPLKSEVLGVAIEDDAIAIEITSLLDGPARWFVVGDTQILVVPTAAGARVYDSTTITFTGSSGDVVPDVVMDDIDVGDLEQLVAEQSFWFAWFSRYANTTTWPVSG